jgi:hypothetical protein
MKQNNPKEIVLYEPYAKQKLLHNYCDVTSLNFWTVVVSGRQAGKSTAGENQACYWSLKDDGCLVWYVCPTEDQANKIYKDICHAAGETGLIKSKTSSKGGIQITWTNGSRIQFKSASSGSNLRGASVNYLIVDEAAWVKESTMNEDIMGVLTAVGKKGLIMSTPKGKNWLYSWYLKGLDVNKKNYKSLKFTSYDNPYCNKEQIKDFKENLPEQVYQQEYMAEFVDSATVFKNIDDVSVLNFQEPIDGEVYHAGIDIGMLHDDTVITVLDNAGNQVFYDNFTGLQSPQIVSRLLETLNKWKPISALMEENNQGLPILQMLQLQYPNIQGFKTTNKSKEEIINNLIAAFSGKEIRIIKSDYLSLQLQGFIFELTPSGKVRYAAASGFQDDAVMSLAIAWESYVKNKSGSRYAVISNASLRPQIESNDELPIKETPKVSSTPNLYNVMCVNRPRAMDDF